MFSGITLLLLTIRYRDVDANALTTISATVGDRVTLYCSTELVDPALWTFRKTSLQDEKHRDIVIGGMIIDENKEWCELSQPTTRDYHLVIRSVSLDRSGYYTCVEDDGFGSKHHFYLNVTGECTLYVCSQEQ